MEYNLLMCTQGQKKMFSSWEAGKISHRYKKGMYSFPPKYQISPKSHYHITLAFSHHMCTRSWPETRPPIFKMSRLPPGWAELINLTDVNS